MDLIQKQKVLLDTIRQKAKAEAQNINSQAQDKAAEIKAEAQQKAQRLVQEIQQRAAANAEKEYLRIVSTAQIDKTREILKCQEEILEQTIEKALEKLRVEKTGKIQDLKEILFKLACLAVEGLPDTEQVILSVSAKDEKLLSEDFLNRVAEEMKSRNRKVKVGKDSKTVEIDGGVVARDQEGRRIFDNSFRARLKRSRENLRMVLYKELFSTGGSTAGMR